MTGPSGNRLSICLLPSRPVIICLILDNSAIWLVKRNHRISKCMAEFHPEECATHVGTQ